jgi:tRNA(Met) cytidine acetyltransferase
MEEAVAALRAEARRARERRLLVLAGEPAACRDRLPAALAAAGVEDAVLVGHADIEGPDGRALERHAPKRAGALLGTTREAVVLDCHEECRPNALGRTVGVADGGGLVVLLTPPLAAWPERRDRFDRTLAAPPDGVEDVGGRFRGRLVRTLRDHPGVAVIGAEDGAVERDGLTGAGPARDRPAPRIPGERAFPRGAYEACLTRDQVTAVRAFERLRHRGEAVVVEADRGRGKSSAAGLAAGALAAQGREVLVTAPTEQGAGELLARARELLAGRDALAGEDDGGAGTLAAAGGGGRVLFRPAARAAERVATDPPDAVFVDEAAGLPVALLERFLTDEGVPVGFTTTVHGYEGTGRGFTVRFRERLRESSLSVTERELREPVRYAAGDPVERWAFRALCLDAGPAVGPAVADATPETVEYGRPTQEELLADEHRLREAFGLLVLAHYRTEPDDLARLLDAPNLHTRLLVHENRVVAVALLAREGGLDADSRARAYRGERIRGNMLPDLLTGQLRDPEAAAPVGYRVVRIATHPSVRSRGLGSALLTALHREFGAEADWFGVAFGATPRLLRFWAANGYRTVHLSTTRNERSGEHSAAMLRPADGRALFERHTRQFRERVGPVLSDSLDALDPDVVRAALAATAGRVEPSLSAYGWRAVVGASIGPAGLDPFPGPFLRLALTALTDTNTDTDTDTDTETDDDPDRAGDGADGALLSPGQERLLVRRVLQGQGWPTVATELGYPSASAARRAAGEAYRPLVERYGGEAAREERARYEPEGADG